MTIRQISEDEYYGIVESAVMEGYDFDEAIGIAHDQLKYLYGKHAQFDLPHNAEIEQRLQELCEEDGDEE
ncbi:hypothetical protein DM48_345 [Burkholderia gladioli]|uniref:Uncharacterized protein n=1 Tax=Burkholderia gladioli TaxID=28095 RepID=A0AAW3F2Q1_BURGA|nr:hypothetical protein [Burkholderia gladioli]KGC14741.1 hypothetical protein DM48_345 [Burkholderia gladioli]